MAAKKRLGDFFAKRNEDGNKGLPTWSVTINNGLVARDTLERKMDTNLSASDHLLMRKGDIAYNMMRMWQGASGLASQDGLVSPAYVVLAPKDTIDPLFAAYWFKSPRMIYLFWAYSYGITKDRLRLYYKDFARIPVTPPPLEKQKRIAALLLSWDEAIEKTSRLIEVKQKLKRGLMQQLLTGKRRFPGCNEDWHEISLKDIGEFSKGTGISKSDLVTTGYPAVRYGELYTAHSIAIREVSSFVSEEGKRNSRKIHYGDILFAGSGEDSVEIGKSAAFLINEEAYAGGDIVVFSPHTGDPHFLSYALNAEAARRHLMAHAQGQTVVHIYSRDLKTLRVPFPPIEEQKKIASALDSLDQEIRLLRKQKLVLQKQRKGLMQQLLTGKVRVPISQDPVEVA